ncbi:MAG: DNA/RNA nuclease SfsA [Immundisolibacteraceae bacterium]|nr:DNA/RNA nuclease SfsA [Immundisolibacteraceae bacterium]
MQLPTLTNATLIKRYKRFLADVVLEDGTEVIAHCPNTGRMTSCWEPGVAVQISHSDNPKRKLAWTLERIDMGQGWIGVHTGRVNHVIAEAIGQNKIASVTDYRWLRQEVTYPVSEHRSRIDIFLTDRPDDDQHDGAKTDTWVEIKNATLLVGDQIQFPDAPTERGRKHLNVLADAVSRGQRGVLLFAVNRPEGTVFTTADQIDPAYGQRLREVMTAGVEVIAVRINHHYQSVTVADAVEIKL